jgi:transcriptional regulator with XRE-family HTH domain
MQHTLTAMKLFSEILRERLSAHTQRASLREIAELSKIDVGQLSRFANDSGKLGQDAIDRLDALLPYLGRVRRGRIQ